MSKETMQRDRQIGVILLMVLFLVPVFAVITTVSLRTADQAEITSVNYIDREVAYTSAEYGMHMIAQWVSDDPLFRPPFQSQAFSPQGSITLRNGTTYSGLYGQLSDSMIQVDGQLVSLTLDTAPSTIVLGDVNTNNGWDGFSSTNNLVPRVSRQPILVVELLNAPCAQDGQGLLRVLSRGFGVLPDTFVDMEGFFTFPIGCPRPGPNRFDSTQPPVGPA